METQTARTHTVPDELHRPGPDYLGGAEHSVVVSSEDLVLRLFSPYQRRTTDYSLNFTDAEHGALVEFGGAVIHQDYAFLVAQPTVIQSPRYGNLGRPTTVIEASVGDLVEFAGRTWRIENGPAFHDLVLAQVL